MGKCSGKSRKMMIDYTSRGDAVLRAGVKQNLGYDWLLH
jgi:hypothetical protein